MILLLKVLLLFSAVAGFLLSFYLFHKKRSREKLVCPAGFKCDQVLHSEYARFFGIPVELLGILYYGFVIVAYTIIFQAPNMVSQVVVFIVTSVSVTAFLFSLYLTFIQAFNIKQWCSWCLTSAGLCTFILFASLSTTQVDAMGVLIEYYDAIFMAHVIAYAVALGVATILDVFFFKFLKDFRISEWESDVLHTISEVLWFAFGFVVLTGVALYFPESQFQSQSPTFLAHLGILLVQLVLLSSLSLLITPRLHHISLKEEHRHQTGELHAIRRWGYSLTSLSFITWYYSFFLAFVQFSGITLSSILWVYAGIGFVAVLASQVIHRTFGRL
ncbi:vitamin K epoxide reductase family protein [Candidatus Uhrbacteria bacterium]|nr:vitamin K epoxide reductase family protein [Candidatus Uhrbacteria bacterium]